MSAPDVGVVLSGVLSDVVLRESWKLVSHQRVHSVKVDLQPDGLNAPPLTSRQLTDRMHPASQHDTSRAQPQPRVRQPERQAARAARGVAIAEDDVCDPRGGGEERKRSATSAAIASELNTNVGRCSEQAAWCWWSHARDPFPRASVPFFCLSGAGCSITAR